jgi:hypothetical protein
MLQVPPGPLSSREHIVFYLIFILVLLGTKVRLFLVLNPVTETTVGLVEPVTETAADLVEPVTETAADLGGPVTETTVGLVEPVTETAAGLVEPVTSYYFSDSTASERTFV